MKKALAVLLVFSVLLSSVSAVWAEDAQIRFSDIPEDYWGKETVDWAIENNLVSGFPDGTFRPEQEITLAEWATFIFRLHKADEWYDEKMYEDLTTAIWGSLKINPEIPKNSWMYRPLTFYIAGFYGSGDLDDPDYAGKKELRLYFDKKMKRWMVFSSMYKQLHWFGEKVEVDGIVKILAPKDRYIYGIEDRVQQAIDEGRAFPDAKSWEDIDPVDSGLEVRPVKSIDFYRYLALNNSYVMFDCGFVNGFPDGTLRPNKYVSRIEALELLRRLSPYLKDVRQKVEEESIIPWKK